MKKERNQIFSLLYVLAIIMVIDDHTSTRVGFLSNIFPYNSFYMPLFVFISGYFYKKRGIWENTKHKIKKLLVPYLIWNIVAILLAILIDRIFGVNWIKKCSITDFLTKNFFWRSNNFIKWGILVCNNVVLGINNLQFNSLQNKGK